MRQCLATLPVVLLFLVGCASTQTPQESWVKSKGGLASAGNQQRVDRAVAGLLDGFATGTVRVRVVDSRDVCAYAWPKGAIYLTRGLVELLDDSEIAAVVAHELGHLHQGGHVRTLVSLNGRNAGVDVESRADLLGRELLRKCQIPPDAMVLMLQKLASSDSLSPSGRRAVRQRIRILTNPRT